MSRLISIDSSTAQTITKTYPYTGIESVEYNAETTDLKLTFTSGNRVIITFITPEIYAAFDAAWLANTAYTIAL